MVAPYAPVGEYAGHWGLDFGVPAGSPVGAAAPGVVTFAGRVGGRASVTIDHGGDLRTSYSYLASIGVRRGDRTDQGTVLGVSDVHGGRTAVHFSLRIGERYIDPVARLVCPTAPWAALRLVPS